MNMSPIWLGTETKYWQFYNLKRKEGRKLPAGLPMENNLRCTCGQPRSNNISFIKTAFKVLFTQLAMSSKWLCINGTIPSFGTKKHLSFRSGQRSQWISWHVKQTSFKTKWVGKPTDWWRKKKKRKITVTSLPLKPHIAVHDKVHFRSLGRGPDRSPPHPQKCHTNHKRVCLSSFWLSSWPLHIKTHQKTS